ncbi:MULTISPECIES: Fic family protein [Methylocystaceae]|uniref:Fic family protein n=1 Tax=Methylosinus sp. R-45379 TaxID=980563 RepID=UPI0009FEA5F9
MIDDIREEEVSFSLLLIRELYALLLQSWHGETKDSGELDRRRARATRCSCPRANSAALSAPCAIHSRKPIAIPPPIKACLLHVQFETIHPLLDGNGFLAMLFLCANDVLRAPLLSWPLSEDPSRNVDL